MNIPSHAAFTIKNYSAAPVVNAVAFKDIGDSSIREMRLASSFHLNRSYAQSFALHSVRRPSATNKRET